MPRWLYAVILCVPAAIVARFLGLPELLIFGLAALGLIPIAALIGKSTEELAHHFGPRAGGLLNATFGNAAELIITAFAIARGLTVLTKAAITGSIIGNALLALGLALLAGGLRHGHQRFDRRQASLNAAMMILAVGGLYLPATFAASVTAQPVIERLSILIAAVLLVIYLAYLVYTVVQGEPSAPANVALEAAPHSQHPERATGRRGGEQGEDKGGDKGGDKRDTAGKGTAADKAGAAGWSVWQGLAALCGATVGAAVAGEVLVDTVEAVTTQLGWSEFFVGVIIVAVVGNAGELFGAIRMAWHNRLNVSLAIGAGSSMQVALLVAPVLVFFSLIVGHPLDLVFQPVELVIIGLATAIFAYISIDGRSNWLEGAQLLALYLMAAVVFFFLPLPRS
ncbi:MAG TPA: hypothetical protein VFW96_01310 [Thermomicrobiales bacterium]|nr:hypothetical protein [Thermomicrobiales bacterium]